MERAIKPARRVRACQRSSEPHSAVTARGVARSCAWSSTRRRQGRTGAWWCPVHRL